MVTEKIKLEYKQTEVGAIPEDWDVLTLNELCYSIKDGTHYTPNYVNQGIPFYSVETLTENNFDNTKFISTEEHQKLSKRCKLEKNDILLTRITHGILGLTKLIDWDANASIYVSLALLKINSKINKKYLYCYTKSSQFLNDIEKYSLQNATPKKINMGEIGKISIPLPPTKEEQISIAEVLFETDDLIQHLNKLITKKKNIKQGAMQELLLEKRRLPGFRADWEVRTLGTISDIKTGKKNNEDKIEDGRYPFFVRSQTVERINSYSFDGEAILVPGEGGIGNIFHYINDKFDYHQRVYKISNFSEDINGKFVFYYMLQNFNKQAMKHSVKATVDSLRLPTFQEFELFIPKDPKEQSAIAQVLSDTDAEIASLEQKRDKYLMLKKGMMQQLLTGRIRLI